MGACCGSLVHASSCSSITLMSFFFEGVLAWVLETHGPCIGDFVCVCVCHTNTQLGKGQEDEKEEEEDLSSLLLLCVEERGSYRYRFYFGYAFMWGVGNYAFYTQPHAQNSPKKNNRQQPTSNKNPFFPFSFRTLCFLLLCLFFVSLNCLVYVCLSPSSLSSLAACKPSKQTTKLCSSLLLLRFLHINICMSVYLIHPLKNNIFSQSFIFTACHVHVHVYMYASRTQASTLLPLPSPLSYFLPLLYSHSSSLCVCVCVPLFPSFLL